MDKGKIIVISAPSGTGKTTILKSILKEIPELVFSVSATTRKKRSNEVNGKDYFFITEEEFKERINRGDFIEWEKVYDYYYGTLKSFIYDNIDAGHSVILELDVKGALALKKIYNDAILIYISPPDIDELVKRLKNRKTESDADFRKRIERAKMELSRKDEFDYLILNEELVKAVKDTKGLISKLIKE